MARVVRKLRLDQLLVEQSLAPDLEAAARLVMAGLVHSGDRVWDKPGEKIPVETVLAVKKKQCPWVSWGGAKLDRALSAFAIDPAGWRCLDVGASTGGFTDVLLQRGAREVTALDVGYGILDWKLRQDPRVKLIERTNFREVAAGFFPEPFDLIVIDVSFISLRLILPKAFAFLKEGGCVLSLIKPQFEASPEKVAPGGIVTSAETRLDVVMTLRDIMREQGFFTHRLCVASNPDPKKNQEFIAAWATAPNDFAWAEASVIDSLLKGN